MVSCVGASCLALLALPSLAMPPWPIHSWPTLVRGGHPMGCWLHVQLPAGLSLQGLEEHSSTDFSAHLFPWVHLESLLSQDTFFYLFKMCCFHRPHLLLGIVPMDKGREGTKPAFDSRIVSGLQAVRWLGQVSFLKRPVETTSQPHSWNHVPPGSTGQE